MARRATEASGYRTRSPIARGETPITRNSRRRESERSLGCDEKGGGGDAHHPAEPFHISATKPAPRFGKELRSRDDSRLATSGKGRGVDRIWPELCGHVSPSCLLR